jgi:hypothetical protein
LHNGSKQSLASFMGEFFGIIEALWKIQVIKNNRRSHHRPSPRPTPGFVNAADERVTFGAGVEFERKIWVYYILQFLNSHRDLHADDS